MRKPPLANKVLVQNSWSGKRLVVVISIVQLVILVGLVIWNFQDPRLEYSDITHAFYTSGELRSSDMNLLRFLYCLSCGLLALQFSTFFWADSHIRSLKFAALALTIFAGDLAAVTNWQQISWAGRRSRVRPTIAELNPIAENLFSNWPKEDGVNPTFGPFMAYPTYDPSILILLTPYQIAENTYIAGIDRTGAKVLRFELSDGQHSVWIELHKDGSSPEKFTSGLDQRKIVDREIKVGQGWYLVRYHNDNQQDEHFAPGYRSHEKH